MKCCLGLQKIMSVKEAKDPKSEVLSARPCGSF